MKPQFPHPIMIKDNREKTETSNVIGEDTENVWNICLIISFTRSFQENVFSYRVLEDKDDVNEIIWPTYLARETTDDKRLPLAVSTWELYHNLSKKIQKTDNRAMNLYIPNYLVYMSMPATFFYTLS